MQTPESYEKKRICEYLDSIGAWYCKPATYGFGKSGTPDIVACVHGHFVSIEVKREGKEPTPLQLARIRQIKDAGGSGYWGTARKVLPELHAWYELMFP